MGLPALKGSSPPAERAPYARKRELAVVAGENVDPFVKDMVALGFTMSEAAGLDEIVGRHAGRWDRCGAIRRFAEEYLSRNIGGQEDIYSSLMTFYSASVYLNTSVPNFFLRDITVRWFVALTHYFEERCGMSGKEALDNVVELRRKSMYNFDRAASAIVDGGGDHKKILETLTRDEQAGVSERYFLFNAYLAGIEPENTVAIDNITSDYDPSGWEGVMHPCGGPSRAYFHDDNHVYPAWLGKGDIRELINELEARDIEPSEAFLLLANSEARDVPATKREFLAILSRLRHSNGVEYFGRYDMSILKFALKQDRSKRHVVVIMPKADYNGVLRKYQPILHELMKTEVYIDLFEVGRSSEFFGRLKDSSRTRKIDTLMVMGHGCPFGFQLSKSILDILNRNSGITSLDISSLPADAFSKGADIILNICSGAKFRPVSLANLLHLQTGARVFANTEDGKLRECDFTPSGRTNNCIFTGEEKESLTGTVIGEDLHEEIVRRSNHHTE